MVSVFLKLYYSPSVERYLKGSTHPNSSLLIEQLEEYFEPRNVAINISKAGPCGQSRIELSCSKEQFTLFVLIYGSSAGFEAVDRVKYHD